MTEGEFFGVLLEEVIYEKGEDRGATAKLKDAKDELVINLCEVIKVQQELIKHFKA